MVEFSLADTAYAAGWKAVGFLPHRLSASLFSLGATRAARRFTPQSQLVKNLARITSLSPEHVPQSLIDESMQSYARYWREAFSLPRMNHTELVADIDRKIVGHQHLEAAIAENKGVIIALPHCANWDLAGLWLAYKYGSFATVAERLQPESLFERFVAYREKLGFTVYPLTGGETPSFAELVKHLHGQDIVCLLGERDLRHTGIKVDFFSHQASFPAGPAKLALTTGAPLLPVGLHYDRDGMVITIYPAVPPSDSIEQMTQGIATAFEHSIAAHPRDWHMLQTVWEADRRP